jgi:hypothetical protein
MLVLEGRGIAWEKLEVITYGWVKAKSLTAFGVQTLLSCGKHFKRSFCCKEQQICSLKSVNMHGLVGNVHGCKGGLRMDRFLPSGKVKLGKVQPSQISSLFGVITLAEETC